MAGSGIDFSSSHVTAERPSEGGQSSSSHEFGWNLAVIFSSALYLFLNLFGSFSVPYLLSGDQVFFWTAAQRMLHGEHIYRDFFQFTPPGTDLIYLLAFKFFGERVVVTNVIVLVLGVFLCWLCYVLSRTIMPRTPSLHCAAFFLVFVYGRLLNATHHWFSLAAVLVAVAIVIRWTTLLGYFSAGMLLGLASFFTQTRGPAALLGIAFFIAWERHRTNSAESLAVKRVLLLSVGFMVMWIAASGYFIATLGLGQLFDFQATYAARFMTSLHSLGLPESFSWNRPLGLWKYLIIYLMLPLGPAFAFMTLREKRNALDSQHRAIALLAFVGLALALEVAPSPNWLRVLCVAMPAIILVFGYIEDAYPRSRTLEFSITILLIGTVSLGTLHTVSRRRQQTVVLLPAGPVMTTSANAAKLRSLMNHTKPGDTIFQSGMAWIYCRCTCIIRCSSMSLETRNLTRPEYVEAAVRQLQAAPVRYIRLGSED